MGITRNKAADRPSNPNLLLNPEFLVWQRGDGPTTVAVSGLLADRWSGWRDLPSASTTNMRRNKLPTAAHVMPDGLRIDNAIEVKPTTEVAGNSIILRQVVEDLDRIIRGQTITLSVYLYSTSAQDLQVDLRCNDKRNGWVDVKAGWNRYETTISMDDTEHTLKPHAYFDIGVQGDFSGSAVTITGAKLEIGEVATRFEHTHGYGEELSRCRRYYVNFDGRLYTYNYDPNNQNRDVHLPVRMVRRPTISATWGAGSGAIGTYGPPIDTEEKFHMNSSTSPGYIEGYQATAEL